MLDAFAQLYGHRQLISAHYCLAKWTRGMLPIKIDRTLTTTLTRPSALVIAAPPLKTIPHRNGQPETMILWVERQAFRNFYII